MDPIAGLRRWFARLPSWVRVAVGVLTIALGVVITFRPTTSLGVLALLIGAGLVLTGVLELTGGGEVEPGARPPRWRGLLAGVWIAAGAFVLAWPGLTVRVLALVVGIALILNGVASGLAAFRRGITADARVASGAFGVAGVAFGVLALAWPDITLLVVAVVFGARLIMSGVGVVWVSLRPRERRDATAADETDAAPRPRTWRRWARTVAAVLALVPAGVAASVSLSISSASPVVDDFYAAPRTVPDEPGELIRAAPFTRGVPDDAIGWRILYTTTNLDGHPAISSGIVVVPREGEGDWPVIDWAHGTTGVAQHCAPSLSPEPFESGALFVLPEVIANGWALVATDYIGLGTAGPHPYLIGEPTGHAVLDAVRAARQLDEARLGEQTVVWGHSQGGGAALWTGVLADEYAPDVPLDGVAALAPAADLAGLAGDLPSLTGGSLVMSFVIAAYAQVYEDVTYREYVRPGAEVTVREMATRCFADPATLVSVLALMGLSRDPDILASDPTSGPLGARLAANTPPADVAVPLLIGQGAADRLILRETQDAYVDGLCAAGRQVDYRVYEGRDHVPLVQPDSPLIPELLEWTRSRLAGDPVEPGCVRSGP
nr:lipase family protein [Microbacterium immunditiarum]